ncbi:MAG: histidine phosphatase family protein [Cellulophaga sp.]
MKSIILVRHGKSSWEDNVDDKDRTLLLRGITDAHLIASELASLELKIDAVLSSPAIRALHTSAIFLQKLYIPFSGFQIKGELYDFSGEHVANLVKSLEDSLDTVLLFGHNNAFTNIVNAWGDKSVGNVPTAGLVQIDFEVDSWSEITTGNTKRILFPKNFR